MTITATRIELDRASDMIIPLTFRDMSGQPIDISTSNLTFNVKGVFSLVPQPHATNPQGRQLHFTEEHAAAIDKAAPGVGVCYFMLTQSDNDFDRVLWRGEIVAVGTTR